MSEHAHEQGQGQGRQGEGMAHEDDESREAWFTEQLRLELRRHLRESEAHAYEVAGPFDLNWRGLARYWRKRSTR